jgi:hypothetical protein
MFQEHILITANGKFIKIIGFSNFIQYAEVSMRELSRFPVATSDMGNRGQVS